MVLILCQNQLFNVNLVDHWCRVVSFENSLRLVDLSSVRYYSLILLWLHWFVISSQRQHLPASVLGHDGSAVADIDHIDVFIDAEHHEAARTRPVDGGQLLLGLCELGSVLVEEHAEEVGVAVEGAFGDGSCNIAGKLIQVYDFIV